MLLLKFSIFFLALSTQLFARAFTDDECISSNFKLTVSGSSSFFGAVQNKLGIEKERCIIIVTHSKVKNLLEKYWKIDVCREPVHIKEGNKSVEVLKRENYCETNSKQKRPYCDAVKDIEGMLQDDGLIFAQGEKEDLGSQHGQVYCTYVLVKKYLKEGFVFNRHQHYEGVIVPVTSTNLESNFQNSQTQKNDGLPDETIIPE